MDIGSQAHEVSVLDPGEGFELALSSPLEGVGVGAGGDDGIE